MDMKHPVPSAEVVEKVAKAIWMHCGQPFRAVDVVPAMRIREIEPDWERFVPAAHAAVAVIDGTIVEGAESDEIAG
jgi:hypothetical protein